MYTYADMLINQQLNFFILASRPRNFTKTFSTKPSPPSHLTKPRICTQRIFYFGILPIQPETRLHLPHSDRFGSKRKSVWIQINRDMVNTIRFRFELTKFQKVFSVCGLNQDQNYIALYNKFSEIF